MTKRRGRGFKLLLGALIAAGVVIVLVVLAVATGQVRTYRIPSPAMAPTLNVNDRIVVARTGFPFSAPHRNDIIVFHPPLGSETQQCGVPASPNDGQPCPKATDGQSNITFVKRIVGMPGDELAVKDNRVYINGKALDEPFIARGTPCSELCNLPKPIKIEPGHYYVLGDNRGESDDSRDWGPIPRDAIIGRKIFGY